MSSWGSETTEGSKRKILRFAQNDRRRNQNDGRREMKKKYTQLAKKMLRASLKGDQIDSQLVGKVLKELISHEPSGLTKILKIYKNLISAQLAKEELIIEAATLPPLSKSALLKKTGAKRIIFNKNPQLVFGAKIKHGDWIWEETLDSRLNQIKSNQPNNPIT